MGAAKKIDVDFVKIFAAATLDTLKIQCSFEAKAGRPFAKGSQDEFPVDIAGVIGISSKNFCGAISVGFPMRTYLKIMSGMLGENFSEMSEELQDGAGELVNIIFGSAKKSLSERGYTVDRAIPTVVMGSNLRVNHMSEVPIVIIPFQSKDGPFQIEIVVE